MQVDDILPSYSNLRYARASLEAKSDTVDSLYKHTHRINTKYLGPVAVLSVLLNFVVSTLVDFV